MKKLHVVSILSGWCIGLWWAIIAGANLVGSGVQEHIAVKLDIVSFMLLVCLPFEYAVHSERIGNFTARFHNDPLPVVAQTILLFIVRLLMVLWIVFAQMGNLANYRSSFVYVLYLLLVVSIVSSLPLLMYWTLLTNKIIVNKLR